MKISSSSQIITCAIVAFLMFIVTWDVSSLIISSTTTTPTLSSFSSSSLQYFTTSLDANDYISRRLSNDDDYTLYNNVNDTYKPNQFVEYGHKLTGQKFSTKMSYLQRVLYTPIVIFGLGALALFLFNLGLLCRCCFQSCKCLPQQENEIKYKQNELILNICFYLFLILVLIIDQMVFLGNDSVDKGVHTIDTNIQSLQSIINDINTNAKLLQAYGYDLSIEYTAAESSCTSVYIQGYSNDIATYQSSMDDLVNSLHPVVKQLNNVHDYLSLYGIFYRQIALYIVWGLAIVCSLCIFFCKLIQTLNGMKCFLFFTMLVYCLYLILGIPWVLLTSLGGDLCMSPTSHLLSTLSSSSGSTSQVYTLAHYYATCQGNNTLTQDIDTGMSSLYTMNSSLTLLLTPPSVPGYNCPGDTNVEDLQTTLNSISNTINVIDEELLCPPIQSIWFNSLNTGICEE